MEFITAIKWLVKMYDLKYEKVQFLSHTKKILLN